MEASEELVCRFVSEHEHPLGSPSQRGRWPFMLPVEDKEDLWGDEPWRCVVCLDVGCSDYALVCALGCPRVGVCRCCAEMTTFDDAKALEWTSAEATPEAALFRAVCGPADPATGSEVADTVRKLIAESHPDLNRTGLWACISVPCVVPGMCRKRCFDGSSPLHAACFFGHGPAVAELIRAGAAVDARDARKITPLHCAAAMGRDDIVRALLEAGADPTAQDEVCRVTFAEHDLLLPLCYAAARGHTAAVSTLLAAAPGSASSRSSTDATPLHRACSRFGNAEIVGMLVEAFPEGAALPGFKQRLLPLHAAVSVGAAPDIIAVLLRANQAATMTQDVNGNLPLHRVGKHSHAESVRRVLEAVPEAAERPSSSGWLPLHCAAAVSAGAEVVRLVAAAYPAAASAALKDGCLPLHFAVADGAPLESVRALLDLNPSAASHADQGGRLPLHFVGAKTSAGVAEFLLAAHPDAARTPTSNGRLPLHMCVARAAPAEAIAAVAAANPAAARVSDKDGNLVAHMFQANASAELVTTVLRANPEAAATRNGAGRLPLYTSIATATAAAKKSGVGTEEGLLALARAYPAAARDLREGGLHTGHLGTWRCRRLAWRALRHSIVSAASAAGEVAQREMAVALLHPLICRGPAYSLRKEKAAQVAKHLHLPSIRNWGEILRDPFVRTNPAALELALELLGMVPEGTLRALERRQQPAAEAHGDGAATSFQSLASALAGIAIADETSAVVACSAILILSQLCKREQGPGFADPPTCNLLAVARHVLCRARCADHSLGWSAAAAIVASSLSEFANANSRRTYVARLIGKPGVLFDLISASTGDTFTQELLLHVDSVVSAALADPGMAFAPLLEGVQIWREEAADMLAGDWSRLASGLTPVTFGGGGGAGGVVSAEPAPLPDLPLALCAILCLPCLDADSRAEWRQAPASTLVGLLLEPFSANRLSAVVSTALAELLAASARRESSATAAPGAPPASGGGVSAAASSASALSTASTAALPRSRLEHARLYTFRLILLKLSDVVDWHVTASAAGGSDGGSGSGASSADNPDARPWKRVRPNPSADAGFETEMLAGDLRPFRVQITVGGPEITLRHSLLARWLSPESPFLRLFDVQQRMDCTVVFRNWDESDSPYLKAEEVVEYFLGASRFLYSLDESRDPEASLPAGLDPAKLFAMAAYMQFPALLDACFGRLDLADAAALEMLTFYLSRAAALVVAPRAEDSSGGESGGTGAAAGCGPRALVACGARLLRLAAEKPSEWPAHLLPDAARVHCAEAAADALKALTADA